MSSYKNTYRVVLLSIFIGANVLILFGIGQLFSYLNTGADRSSILHVTLPDARVYLPKVIWENTNNPGRPIEEQTLSEIESNYLQSLYVKNVAYKTNNSFGINDFYTQSARLNILNHLQDQKEKNIQIEATSIHHNLSLDFYSLDGQLAVLTDRDSKQYQRVFKDDKLVLETEVEANYKVVLLLEDGFWKTRHLVKQPSSNLVEKETTIPLCTVKENNIYVGDTLYQVKGINYYPQNTPWDMFGEKFDIKTIAKDFEIIKKLNLNTIRIFVGYKDFGKAEVIPEKLNKLKQVLDLAKTHNLKAIVTLFDFYGNYEVLDWTLTHRHVEQVVSVLKDHTAILAWDAKNEPNLDFQTRNKTTVLAWLKETITQIKKYDPNHLITIGWSNTDSADLLKDKVDFVSFHYYEDLSEFEGKYSNLTSRIKKPLVLQEYGLSSSKGLWDPLGANEKKQAKYYTDFQEILNKNNIHYLPWTLYDFTQVPSSVVGKLPWRKHQQKHFGFIDNGGNPKKAFEVLKGE